MKIYKGIFLVKKKCSSFVNSSLQNKTDHLYTVSALKSLLILPTCRTNSLLEEASLAPHHPKKFTQTAFARVLQRMSLEKEYLKCLHLLLHRKAGKFRSPPPSGHLYPLETFTWRGLQTLISLDKSQMNNQTHPTCPSCSSGHLHVLKTLPSTVIPEQGRQEKRHLSITLGGVSITLLRERGPAFNSLLV